jgi:hypothetical protein
VTKNHPHYAFFPCFWVLFWFVKQEHKQKEKKEKKGDFILFFHLFE